jgi:hypothetical protein
MITTLLQFPPRGSGAGAQAVLLAGVLALWSMPALAQAPAERLSDKSVKALVDQVDEGRDKFEGNLDGAFKGSTVRGPNGETKVSAVLQDYQDSTKKLQGRFTPDYPAGPEVATVLKLSTAIDAFMKGQPSTMKGRREWERQVENLKALAAAYGTTFPLPDGATVRRMNDKEPLAAATSIAAAADRLKSAFDKDKTLAKPDKDAAKKDAETLGKQANTVKDRLRDGKPATGDVRLLVEHAAKIETFVGAHEIPAAAPHWQSVQTWLGKLQEAFGLTKEPS